MRTCKSCKEKFEPTYSSVQMTCSVSCAIDLTNANSKKKWKKDKLKRKKELMTLQDHIKITQVTFNKFIRLNDKKLNNPCMSCRKPLEKKYDAGHFYNANNHWNLRFDERNVYSQCVYCNQHLHGNLLEYRKQLEFYYGITFLNELEKDSNITRKFTIDEVKEINDIYKDKIKKIK